VVVVFALMTHRRDRHGPLIDDLEQRHVPGMAERDDQLAQEGARPDLSTRERELLEQLQSILDGLKRLLGQLEIGTVAHQFRSSRKSNSRSRSFDFGSEDDAIGHRLAAVVRRPFARALSKRVCSFATTEPALMYRPVPLAASGDAMPRATNSACSARRRTVSRTEVSTNDDSVSPSCSTRSSCWRNSGSTRLHVQLGWSMSSCRQCGAFALHRLRSSGLQTPPCGRD